MILLMLQSVLVVTQSLPLWRADSKFLRENYPNKSDSIYGNMLRGLYRIRETVSDAILEFRIKANPEINPKSAYDTLRQRYRSPLNVFNLPSIDVVMEIQPFEFMMNDQKIRPRNFFVVRKKGTKIFSEFRTKDTVSLTQYDKYYPFDEKLLVYCDLTEGYSTDVKILSGACDVSFFDIRPYNRTTIRFTEPRDAAFFRLYRFGLEEFEQLKQFYPTNNPQDTISWFRIDSFPLAKGHTAVVKVPTYDKFSDKYNYFDGIEVLYYEWPLIAEGKGTGFWEVKYTFHNHPKSYEDTLPKYRKLEHEDLVKMGHWYFETFVEPVKRLENAPDEKR